VQLRDGALNINEETLLVTIAKTAGLTTNEYLDLILQMLCGDAKLRTSLKELFPKAKLEMWESDANKT
jgi:hypothetical protein